MGQAVVFMLPKFLTIEWFELSGGKIRRGEEENLNIAVKIYATQELIIFQDPHAAFFIFSLFSTWQLVKMRRRRR